MSSVADTTSTSQRRSVALSVMESTHGVGSCLVDIVTGYLIQKIGFLSAVLVSTAIAYMLFIVILIWVKETMIFQRKFWLSLSKAFKHLTSFYRSKSERREQSIWLLILYLNGFIFINICSSTRTP